jgi:hypothetical protein
MSTTVGCPEILAGAVKKEAIIGFHLKNPLEGYRRLTFMMLDHDVVAVSPARVWRMLKQAGLLSRWKAKSSRKGIGFEQAAGNPEARPRIISENGPQFIADFKEFIRISGKTHVCTSPFYPQANGSPDDRPRSTRLAIASWNRLVASANFVGSRRCLRGLRQAQLQ